MELHLRLAIIQIWYRPCPFANHLLNMPVVQRLLSRPLIAFGVLVLAIAVVGMGLHGRNGHKVLLNTATVKRGDLVATITATGTIEPVEVVDVGAQVAGLILSFGKDKDGRTI